VPIPPAEVSRLLRAWGDGDQAALDQLTPLVYSELHQIAHRHMRQQLPGQTLQTTALVNEAYLRLVNVEGVRWQDRTHFFAVSAQIMRRILVDSARAHLADKRGGRLPHVYLDESMDASPQSSEDLIALDDALIPWRKWTPARPA
jgi:RNA polymerase sigma factor (TIGR02999 family)